MLLNSWNRRTALCLLGATGLAASLLTLPAHAADVEVVLVIRDHRFAPAEVKVPAGQRVKLVIDNQDKTPEEFESKSLKREKVIPAGAKVPVLIGPLQPGRYPFYGEYHEATARGVVVVE